MRQSRWSTSVTAPGRLSAVAAGKTARATAAASATASAPPMRVVFFVANDGKPRPSAACFSVPRTPITGWLRGAVPLPQPAASASGRQASAAASSVRARIAEGQYDNLRAGLPFDRADTRPRPGVLSARLERRPG